MVATSFFKNVFIRPYVWVYGPTFSSYKAGDFSFLKNMYHSWFAVFNYTNHRDKPSSINDGKFLFIANRCRYKNAAITYSITKDQ